MNKVCTKCKINKPLEEYSKDNRAKDGRTSACKSCYSEYNKTDKGKATHAKHMKTDKGKATKAKADTKYWRSDKGKATRARGNHNRRINIANTLNDLNDKEFSCILFLQDNQCIGPNHEGSRYFTDKVKPQRDHINPVSKGGNFTKETVQALCKSCDSKKYTKYIDYRSDYHKEMIKNYLKKGETSLPCMSISTRYSVC